MTSTERLSLSQPTVDDLADLFRIQSDPRVWEHYPSLCYAEPGETLADIERWRTGWTAHGLDAWTVALRDGAQIIGYGGCSARGPVWNLGYRLSPAAHGRGLATELARAALDRARVIDASRPIVAKLVEHNQASQRVAVKLGMELAYRALDAGNPDSSAVRLVFADRLLTRAQLISVVS